MNVWKTGDRAYAFDHLRYKDDRTTPLHTTMRHATVLKVYNLDDGRPVADLRFDCGMLSKAHFTWALSTERKTQ